MSCNWESLVHSKPTLLLPFVKNCELQKSLSNSSISNIFSHYNDTLQHSIERATSHKIEFPCQYITIHASNYNATYEIDIVIGIPTLPNTKVGAPLPTPIQQYKVQFIEITYYNDYFSPPSIETKINKYKALIQNTYPT